MQTQLAVMCKLQKMSMIQQRELYDYADFLLSRKSKMTAITSRKATLLKMSVWSDDDIALLEEAAKGVNEWTIPQF